MNRKPAQEVSTDSVPRALLLGLINQWGNTMKIYRVIALMAVGFSIGVPGAFAQTTSAGTTPQVQKAVTKQAGSRGQTGGSTSESADTPRKQHTQGLPPALGRKSDVPWNNQKLPADSQPAKRQ
ncbi:MAG TPA: hypothetical protein VHU42_05590 [Rhodopila sp.]|nr:hypothetical protein [Rhodopila sp.]